MKRNLSLDILFALYLLFWLTTGGYSADLAQPPATPKKSVTDEYYGIRVTDDYRWLDNLSDPEVRKWKDQQNQYTRQYLDRIPGRQVIYDRLKELFEAKTIDYYDLKYRRGILFALKHQPPKEQPFLIALQSPNDTASQKVIVDPNVLDAKGTTAIDFYVPSLDGKLVAVSLSKNGSEDGTLHIFEVQSGKELPDLIPRVNYPTGAGSVAWNADSSGFYYTRYPHEKERSAEDLNFYQQVYFHKLGSESKDDVYAVGKQFPRIAETELEASDDGRYILARIKNGDGGELEHFVRNESGKWIQITQFSDKITKAFFGADNNLYLLSRKNAPLGKILQLSPANPNLANASIIVEQGKGAIDTFVRTDTELYVVDVIGGPSQIRVIDPTERAETVLPLKPISAVDDAVRLDGDQILFQTQTFTDPPAWYEFNPSTGKPVRTALVRTWPADFSDTEVVREFATSKDGTKVPMNIIKRKGTKLNGQNPTILYGYGGYGINESPSFSVRRRLWLDYGGVYVITNIRGGGEFGEQWHLAGNLTRKQNDFDDFAACAEYLIKTKYTNPSKLSIEGGSNGGLLMGATLTQHPDLFRAVVSYSGIYDMLRVELFPNGAFNVTEYGTVKNPDQFKALYAYSPYHHVADRTAYPAVLFLTGDNDGRVDPANSRKMTARLQTATASGHPIFLRTSSSSGHGIGTALSERIAQQADVFAFLFDQLEIAKKN